MHRAECARRAGAICRDNRVAAITLHATGLEHGAAFHILALLSRTWACRVRNELVQRDVASCDTDASWSMEAWSVIVVVAHSRHMTGLTSSACATLSSGLVVVG